VSDKLLVQLNTEQVVLEPGGAPFELVITVQNLGDVVDQYSVDVTGLESDWFTAPVTSVGLFPQDREQVRVNLHPPRRPGLRAGAYPFRVLVRSRGGAEQEAAEGSLLIRGMAVYRLDITPRRMTARGSGTFQVQLSNTGNADVRLALEGRDANNACRLAFADPEPMVTAGNKKDVRLTVKPLKRPWVGQPSSYDFTVTARPQDATGEPQTVPAQFTHKPLFASWAPLRRLAFILAIIIAIPIVLAVLIGSGVAGEAPSRFGSSTAQVRRGLCGVPVLGALCPKADDTLAFQTASNANAEDKCAFEFGFKDYADAEPKLVGDCTSAVYYDGFGNGVQYTKNGMLLWQKESNTVYFFRASSVWAYIQGHSQLLYGSGAI
jgi:hypothetical protein